MLGGLLVLRSGWAAIIGYHAGILAVIALARGWSVFSRIREGWKAGTMALMVVGYVAGGPVIWLLWPLARLDGLSMVQGLSSLGLTGGPWIGFVVYYTLVNPVLEEVYWRGLWGEETLAPAPSDLLYTGYHCVVLSLFVGIAWIAVAFVILMGAAWLWRRVAGRTGGLMVPVASHLAADASIISAAILLS